MLILGLNERPDCSVIYITLPFQDCSYLHSATDGQAHRQALRLVESRLPSRVVWTINSYNDKWSDAEMKTSNHGRLRKATFDDAMALA